MRYLVDGYNVTMGDPSTRGLSLERQREALVRRLAVRGEGVLGRGRVTVFFDGRSAGGNTMRHGDIEVRFTRDESADDAIVRFVGSCQEPLTLVTSDRGLAARARSVASCEVRIESRERLFEAGRSKRGGRRLGGSTAGLPKGANRITEELKRIWLEGDE